MPDASIENLRAYAERCRQLARSTNDQQEIRELQKMAAALEAEANARAKAGDCGNE
jgi:prefoldin subunit 5